MFLRSQGKRVHVNTLIRASGVRLVRLDPREVRTFTLRESVLAVKLELSGDDGVLSPAMHVQRGLREDKGAGIRDARVVIVRVMINNHTRSNSVGGESRAAKVNLIVGVRLTMPVSRGSEGNINSAGVLEHTVGINVSTGILGNGSGATESVDSIGQSINGISVVEGLGTEDFEQEGVASQR